MAKLSHSFEYYLTRLGIILANLFSAKMADRLAVTFGNLGYRLFGSRRRIAYDNLQRALGDSMPADELVGITHRVFQNTARTMFEVCRFGRLTDQYLADTITGDKLEHVKKAVANGRGGIILTAHFGNWELMGAWLVAQGLKVDFVVGQQHNERVNELLIKYRRRVGAGIIALPRDTRKIFKAIKGKRLPAMLSDQHAPNGLVSDFFGRPAATARGVALFSVRANCPIFPILMRRERYDHHVVMAGEPIYPPNSGDEEADIRTITETHMKYVESQIRAYPDQWLWTHRRWKLPEESMQPA